MHDPDSNTWTLFDDEKVRPLSRVNSHGSVGRKAANANTNVAGKGGAPGGLEKIGSRIGEADANEDAAKAESDADADLLGSVVKVIFVFVFYVCVFCWHVFVSYVGVPA